MILMEVENREAKEEKRGGGCLSKKTSLGYGNWMWSLYPQTRATVPIGGEDMTHEKKSRIEVQMQMKDRKNKQIGQKIITT